MTLNVHRELFSFKILKHTINTQEAVVKLFVKQLGIFVVMLLVLSACVQVPPAPEQPAEPPTTSETPLVDDSAIDQATQDLGTAESLEGAVDDSAGANIDQETAITAPTQETSELSSQAVLPGGKGYIAYAWFSTNSATQPWRIYLHDAATNVTTLVYGGLRQIESVAVSGDGNKIIAAIKETTDATSDYEIYQIVRSPASVT